MPHAGYAAAGNADLNALRTTVLVLSTGTAVQLRASWENSFSVAEPTAAEFRAISCALEQKHGSPRHGNKRNPLDELVYIILSTRTRDESFRGTYKKLKRAYPSWNQIRADDLPNVVRIISPGGLGPLKAAQIVDIIRTLRTQFGRATLAPLKRMENNEAEAFLTRLPGVALKIAKCVLMYSLDRSVLPVDTHVHRLSTRIGMNTKKRPDTSQDLIEDAVPESLRYAYHVNAVAHGRLICLPRSPRCSDCCVATWCRYVKVNDAS
jgi:endonuclease III